MSGEIRKYVLHILFISFVSRVVRLWKADIPYMLMYMYV